MAGERNLWNTLRRHTRQDPSAMFQRHEDTYSVGISDVSYVYSTPTSHVRGWIELKYAPAWPKRDATPLRLRHFTKEQRNWLRKQGELGGHTWLLLQVDRDYILIKWCDLAPLGNVCKKDILNLCELWSRHTLDYASLKQYLITGG